MIASIIEKGEADIFLTGNPIEKHRIRALQEKALGLDVRLKEIMLSSGGRLAYDKLLIATGRNAVLPDAIPNLKGPGVFTFRTIENARNIHAAARNGKYGVVLGGGFVGIKAAIALRRLGLTVTIIEKLERILYEKLDQRGSTLIADLLKGLDIDIVTNQTEYEIIRGSGALRSLRLASGRIINADLIVAALGTKPATGPFRDTGIIMNKGIVVQESLQSSVPDVYAAGDVVECREISSNALAVSTQWPNAREMGRLAGMSMTGSDVRYDGFLSLMHSLEIAHLPVTALGLVNPESSEYEVITERHGAVYRKIVFKNDVMVGALFIGCTEDPGVYTYLIKNRIPLGKLKGMAMRGTLGGNSQFKKAKDFFGI
jgi:NAD(P)H-nitrite reductase large subunit